MTSKNQERANELLAQGLQFIKDKQISEAKEVLQESIDLFATPEAYTYLGWAISLEGQYDEAITLCKKAIDMDADFGNPYNDIGTYLMAKNEEVEALEWFAKAKLAKRYKNSFFPFLNVGRYYLKQERLEEAKTEFLEVVNRAPFNIEAQRFLYRISCMDGKNKHFYFCSLN
ncbi:MAG: Tfp pilus assembly protein PilF [Candidatus Marinamargulisbacteria bacterium]|jgi:Tfp pilus assembly protein PilF